MTPLDSVLLRDLRRREGWTLCVLAALLNVRVTELSAWERNQAEPPSPVLERLAALVQQDRRPVQGFIWSPALPSGLLALMADAERGPKLTASWVRRLCRVEFRGDDLSPEAWWGLYLALERAGHEARIPAA